MTLNQISYPIGSQVNHTTFGTGLVTDRIEDKIVVEFPCGTKRFKESWALLFMPGWIGNDTPFKLKERTPERKAKTFSWDF